MGLPTLSREPLDSRARCEQEFAGRVSVGSIFAAPWNRGAAPSEAPREGEEGNVLFVMKRSGGWMWEVRGQWRGATPVAANDNLPPLPRMILENLAAWADVMLPSPRAS
jgi:hypothetical protein